MTACLGLLKVVFVQLAQVQQCLKWTEEKSVTCRPLLGLESADNSPYKGNTWVFSTPTGAQILGQTYNVFSDAEIP